MLYIRKATLITPTETISNGTLLIDGSKILALGPDHTISIPEGAKVLDAHGQVLAPGFIELQINGGFGHDFTEKPASLWMVAGALPRYGVTAFLPTVITSPLSNVNQALEVWKAGPPVGFKGALPLGYHLEGPMINPAKKGAHNPAYILPPSLEIIEGWFPEEGVRLVTLAPEIPGAIEVIHELRKRGILVSAGHSMATYDEAMRAFDAGVLKGTHLFNAQPPVDHRQPGLSAALLTDRRLTTGMIVDGIHVHPAMVDLAWRLKGPGNFVLVTDAMAALGMPPGNYHLGDYDVIVDDTSARLSNGTLAGSILTQDAAIRNLVSFTKCNLAEAISAATQNPANLLGLDSKGCLEPGADADLVLLSPDGYVQSTWVAGEVVYQKGQDINVSLF